MRQLLLLRHAKSDPGIDDHARPLNDAGREAVAVLRGAMVELGLAPDVVLVSPSRRTLETMELLEPWDEAPLVEPTERLYLASAAQILAVLRDVAETVRSVLVIGHNPGLETLVAILSAGSAADADAKGKLLGGFRTTTLAEFYVSGRWAQLAAGNARLARVIRPRDVALKNT